MRGKTLGIVGYGNIGSQLSTLAEAMGMRVIYFDVADKLRHGNTEPAGSLASCWPQRRRQPARAGDAGDAGLIGAAEIAAMRPGSYLINNSRGTVVDLDALADALRREHLSAPPWTCSRWSRRRPTSASTRRCRACPTWC